MTQDAHTGIKEDETVRTNQIDSTATCLAAKQEYKLFTLGIIELIHKFLPLADGHAPIESEAAIPAPKSVTMSSTMVRIILLAAAEFLKQI